MVARVPHNFVVRRVCPSPVGRLVKSDLSGYFFITHERGPSGPRSFCLARSFCLGCSIWAKLALDAMHLHPNGRRLATFRSVTIILLFLSRSPARFAPW